MEEINKIFTAKQRELVKLAHAKKDYNDLADEIDKIREKKQRILVAKAETEGYKKRIEELQDFINERDMEIDTKGKHHGLHSLRHSLATNLFETGTPVNEIAVILGHTSAASTKTYVWSDIERLRIAALEVPGK